MKFTILISAMLLFSAVAQAETGNSLSIEELFSVDTPEELEASLTDGYPMPWLAEILEDEAIPEEDRYWLDCRMRGFIAENLHTLYREDGRSRVIPCDWLRAGEEYWREILIVNQIGDAPESIAPDMPHTYRESGYLVNLFGEKIGTIAVADSMVRLSRDGRIGVYQSGWRSEYEPGAELFVCFLYSDGSFVEIPIESPFYNKGAKVNVSHDGSLVAFTASDYSRGEHSRATDSSTGDPSSERPYENRLYLFNEDAQQIVRYEIEGILCPLAYPVISPNNHLIALNMYAGGYKGSQVLDSSSGEVQYRSDFSIRRPAFSQNSEQIALSGPHVQSQYLDTSSFQCISEFTHSLSSSEGNYSFKGVSISNNPNQLLHMSTRGHELSIQGTSAVAIHHYDGDTGVRFMNDGDDIETVSGYNGGTLSPNGYFAWLFETGHGQNSSHPVYGSKCMLVDLRKAQ